MKAQRRNRCWVDKDHYAHLLDRNQMLGQIAVEVVEFCRDSESTTYEAVLAMKAELLSFRAQESEDRLDRVVGRRRGEKSS